MACASWLTSADGGAACWAAATSGATAINVITSVSSRHGIRICSRIDIVLVKKRLVRSPRLHVTTRAWTEALHGSSCLVVNPAFLDNNGGLVPECGPARACPNRGCPRAV